MKIKLEYAEKRFFESVVADEDDKGKPLGYLWLGCEGHCFGTIANQRDLIKLKVACERLLNKKDGTVP